jgi:hypothetical protein
MLGSYPERSAEIHNRRTVHDRESDGSVVAMKRGNARGAKGPCRYQAEQEERRPACRNDLTLRETGLTTCRKP